MLRQSFTDFIFATNTDGSGKAASYVRAFDLGDIYLPMGDIDLLGDWDCRDWLKKGIDWWRKEIESRTMNASGEACCLKKKKKFAADAK